MKEFEESEKSPIAEALRKTPLPEPSERFVRKVMISVRESERRKVRWFDWWRVPALGLGLASVLFIAVAAWQPFAGSSESALVAGVDASVQSLDDVLEFGLESDVDEPGGSL